MANARGKEAESWLQYFKEKLGDKFGVPKQAISLIKRHDNVTPIVDGHVVCRGWCAEFEISDGSGTYTVYAWDEPPFVAIRREGAVVSPEDALLAFVARRQR
jgi:hypothetical protein